MKERKLQISVFILCTIIWLQHVSTGIGHGHVVRVSKNKKINKYKE